MRLLQILCFIFTLPLVGVLAHDAYFFYQERQEDPRAPFAFSDIGYLWYTYSQDTHNQVVREVGADTWNDEVRPALRQPAALYAGAVAVASYIITFIVWLFAIWPANKVRKVKEGKSAFASFVKGEKTFKYKRK